MKPLLLSFILFASMGKLIGQQNYIDSLKRELEINQNDTLKLYQLILISEAYEESKPDSAFYYAETGLALASELKFRLNEAIAMLEMAYSLKNMGNYPASLQKYLLARAIAEDIRVEENILPELYAHWEGFITHPVTPAMMRLHVLGLGHLGLGLLYETVNNTEKALLYNLQAAQNFEQAGNNFFLTSVNMILVRIYLSREKTDSALIIQQKAQDVSIKMGYKDRLEGRILLNFGRIQLAMGNRSQAAEYFRKSLIACKEQGYLRGMVAGNLLLFDICQLEGKRDSSLYFANTALNIAQNLNSLDLLLRAYTALAAFYKSAGKDDSTVKYQGSIIKINDSLFSAKQAQQFLNIDFGEQQRHLEIEAAKKAYRGRLQLYGLLAGLAIFLTVAIILWQNNRKKQKAYVLLEHQKKETDFQKAKVEHTLEELRSTQSQLIQSEKMASLGELTAGIAHEIQNPLNFINNFSEINTELLAELKAEVDKGNINEVRAIADDAISNEQKINLHGKRADSIVKGMLQHSRRTNGIKELTDINALADEYLRLAYLALRAKDSSFNATLNTNFDEGIGKISIVPQDIGRVLLNLYNNAFYAVNEKKKQNQDGFEPAVIVRSTRVGDKIMLGIKDNGNGIPPGIVDKIFQPFFTTKPTGQGIGLGLSLSYDIIKAHGGEIQVESKEGEYTEFVVVLPG